MLDEERLVAGQLDGIPGPWQSTRLIGHDAAVSQFCTAFSSGRMHHAWLLSGPQGIGKATLAMHAARHVLSQTKADEGARTFEPSTWSESLVSQVANGSHPDLLHLTRPYDQANKKFKQQLTVDEVRKTQSFYGMTAGGGGWRITIVDSADDMNRNAANALLKVLEEPPKRSLFFLISHEAGRLLPTIRSRCQHLALHPLAAGDVVKVLDEVGFEADRDRKMWAADLCEGSPRRAIQLLESDLAAVHGRFLTLMEKGAEGAASHWQEAHAIAALLARKGSEDTFDLFIDLMFRWIGQRVRVDAGHVSTELLAGWAQVWDKADETVRVAAAYNLDRKQVILDLFALLFERHRNARIP